MTTLIILRHGQSMSNLDMTLAGQRDIKLTELGKTQAQISCEYLYNTYKFDAIFSSPLSRAYETALPLSKMTGLQINTLPALMETKLGDWEGKRLEEVKEDYLKWRDDPDFIVPNGESRNELTKRFGDALKEIYKTHKGQTVLVATHGGCIRTLGTYFNSPENSKIATNASITTLVFDDLGNAEIKEYSKDAHLGNLITKFDN